MPILSIFLEIDMRNIKILLSLIGNIEIKIFEKYLVLFILFMPNPSGAYTFGRWDNPFLI